MESILARALEYTLKYWLKSFTRDQFKLQGRTVQLSNLDINGDALHASLGLPPALNVTTARVGKLEIILPSVSYVQIEPIVVQIDRLDVVLEENDDVDAASTTSSPQTSTSSGKGSGYGFADKIADGMTLQVHTVNLLLETHGGAGQKGGATWASPMASITIRNLLLYTTNECWQAVNLKEARDYSNNKNYIYVFKRLEWESLSIDLLPHPDMFTDAQFSSCQEGNKKDDDGAKRVFFGGERFIEGISGQANITVQRTELNSPLGLEVQLHITEAVCPALSEPGLRALLRFFTGLYVCLNRGDINPNAQQRSAEAAGRSIVSVVVDHIFLCIKDTEFRLELLMQSLLFSRASVSDGENSRFLTQVRIGGLFLRDTFARAPCTLVQPSVQATTESFLHMPEFGKSFCPPIYPVEDQPGDSNEVIPLISLHSLQVKPSPTPPSFAAQTVVECQPLMIHLQEDSCLKIASLLADGIVVTPGAVLPDFSVNSFQFNLKGLDITVPLDIGNPIFSVANGDTKFHSSFAGARLHIENLFFSESPSLKLKLLNLERDPACFSLWKGQPIDASQKKWKTGASIVSLSLETCKDSNGFLSSLNASSGLWRCVELKDACIEVAMTTADGSPLINIPPPGGLVRAGVACQQYLSNTSVDQLFFVVDLYAYLGRVGEKLAMIGKNNRMKKGINEPFEGRLKEKAPSDSAVSLAVSDLQLRFLESSPVDIQGMPLVQFRGEDLSVKVTHRTLGGAIAISSSLCWESVEVNCADTVEKFSHDFIPSTSVENGSLMSNECLPLRPVFWVQKGLKNQPNNRTSSIPFLNISMVHVIPFRAHDMECHSLSLTACIAGVRLGGGMNYTEALLHRFGILGPDGGPGERLCKGLENLSNGPLSKLFKASPLIAHQLPETPNDGSQGDVNGGVFLHLGTPDDVDFSIELKDWLFALEGAQSNEGSWLDNNGNLEREEKCWHTTFKSLLVKAKSTPRDGVNGRGKALGAQKYPVEVIMVGVEGLQTLKPQFKKQINQDGSPLERSKETVDESGVNLEVRIVMSEDEVGHELVQWMVENMRLSVRQPIEAVVTKDELQHLACLCKSEVDSMGRIVAGVLRILRLEGSIGQAAMDQLSNLGTGSFDKILKAERLSMGGSAGSTGVGLPSNIVQDSRPSSDLASTVVSLEEAILESQASCAALSEELCSTDSSMQQSDEIKRLAQKLESMQNLVTKLRNQI